MTTYRNFIDGRWVESKAARRAPNLNPADAREVLGEVPLSPRDEVLAAVAAAERALPAWRATPAPARGRVIQRARDILEARKEEVARALTREEGKILREALGEVGKSVLILEFMAGEGSRLYGETVPSELPNTFCYTIRQPMGVVAAITPWNFPVAIPCWKIAPALAAGCTILFKPATITPWTAQLVVECFEKAGVPPGVLNLVYGSGSEAGQALVEHPATRAVSFTGSNEVGIGLYQAAAALGKKVQCEMGGKNAAIVLDDADLDLAVEGIVQGAFGSTGQRCTATSRVIATPGIAARLLERLVARAREIRLGGGLEATTQMGPCVDPGQFETVLRYLQIGRQEGARVATGGDRASGPALEHGYFVQPTIFADVRPEMRIAQEEIFGPVLAFLVVKDLDEAIRVANGVHYGLSGSIYTRDPNAIFRYVEAVEVGIAHVNNPTIGGEPQLPFGGTKATGIGQREMGRTAIEFFTEIKTVYLDYTGRKRESNLY